MTNREKVKHLQDALERVGCSSSKVELVEDRLSITMDTDDGAQLLVKVIVGDMIADAFEILSNVQETQTVIVGVKSMEEFFGGEN